MSLFERLKNKRLSLQEKKDDKTDKGIKQSEVSKQAKKFTRKINQKNINRPEGIIGDTYVSTDKKGNIRSAKKVNPTLKKSISQVKADIEFKQGIQKVRKFSGQKGTGELSDKAPDKVRKFVQDTRAKRIKDLKLPDTSFDSKTKFSQKQFEKPLKKITKGPRTGIVNPFGKGDTPGQQKVKAMDKRAFKITQPRDIKKTKGYKPYAQLSKEIKKLKTDVAQTASGVKQAEVSKKIAKDNKVYNQQRVAKNLKKGTRNISSMNPSEMERAFGTSSTEGAGGASGSFKTKASKNTMPSGKNFINKYRKQAETATTNIRKKVNTIAKNPKLTGSKRAELSRIEMKKLKVAQNYARGLSDPKKAQTAITLPKNTQIVKDAAKGAIKRSPKTGSEIVRIGPTGRPKTKGPVLLDDIPVKNVPREIRFGKASSAVLKKTPKAIKPIARPALKLLAKAGTPGRIAALGLGAAAISPAGRKALGQLATGAGLTALFGRGKKEKQLKVGDGLKNVGKVRVTADSKGLKRNQADMAKIKATQKNFIDKYNKGRAFGKIKYNVNKQGTYDVIKPKKK